MNRTSRSTVTGSDPDRSAHQAVRAARDYQRAGKRWVVDLDLASFFDEVNHDLLMARVRRRVKDVRLLQLIRAFLQSGVMIGGVSQPSEKGTPQGGSLSPLLSNILLDDLDKKWKSAVTRFVAMRMTATSMWAVAAAGSACSKI